MARVRKVDHAQARMRKPHRIAVVPQRAGVVRAAVAQACAHRVQRAGAVAEGTSHIEKAGDTAHALMLDPKRGGWISV